MNIQTLKNKLFTKNTNGIASIFLQPEIVNTLYVQFNKHKGELTVNIPDEDRTYSTICLCESSLTSKLNEIIAKYYPKAHAKLEREQEQALTNTKPVYTFYNGVLARLDDLINPNA